VCNRKLVEADKAYKYLMMMRKAARSAANVQIDATCTAKEKSWKARIDAIKAVKALNGEEVGRLQRFNFDKCKAVFNDAKLTGKCGFKPEDVAPRLRLTAYN